MALYYGVGCNAYEDRPLHLLSTYITARSSLESEGYLQFEDVAQGVRPLANPEEVRNCERDCEAKERRL